MNVHCLRHLPSILLKILFGFLSLFIRAACFFFFSPFFVVVSNYFSLFYYLLYLGCNLDGLA